MRMTKKSVSLRTYMQAYPQGLGAAEAVSLLMSAVQQLESQHHDGRLHLQISPDTVWVTSQGAVLKAPDKRENAGYESGFAAPEIYNGTVPGIAADIYSMGAVLYYAATGRIIANSLQLEAVAAELAELTQMEPLFGEILAGSMAFAPQNRIQSARKLMSGLLPLQKEAPQQVLPEEPAEEKAPAKRRKSWIWAALLLVYLAVMGVLLWNGYAVPRIQAKKEAALIESNYQAALALMQERNYQQAMDAFSLLGDYKDSAAQIEQCQIGLEEQCREQEAQQREADYQQAIDYKNQKEYGKAAIAFGKLGDYKDARTLSQKMWQEVPGRHTISMSCGFSAILEDGTVKTEDKGILEFRNVVSLANGILLYSDGTVSAYPDPLELEELQSWTDIVAISGHTWCDTYMGLRSDGTVVLAYAEESVTAEVAKWTDIVAIANGSNYFLGLKSDGTVVAAGFNGDGQCDVSDWCDIQQIAVCLTGNGSVGLKTDGTMVGAGGFYREILDWNQITAVFTGPIAIRANGVALRAMPAHYNDIGLGGGWAGVVDVVGNYDIQYGLKSDGTLVHSFSPWPEYCIQWTDIQIP